MGEADELFGDEHVRRYRETGGKVGHIWREGSTILLLTTTGRTSGEKRTTPLIYAEDAGRYVIVASRGAPRTIPAGSRTLREEPGSGVAGSKTRSSAPARGSRTVKSALASGKKRTRYGALTTTTPRRRRGRFRSSFSSAIEPKSRFVIFDHEPLI